MSQDSFPDLVKHLVEVAKRDGGISGDEQQIIDQVTVDLKLYNAARVKALEDKVIDDDESKMLEQLKDKILEHAVETAKLDGYVKMQERDIIKKLISVVHNFVDQ